jgi:hypothetical protein
MTRCGVSETWITGMKGDAMRKTYVVLVVAALGLMGLLHAQTAKDGAAQAPAAPTQPGPQEDGAARANAVAELGVNEGQPVDSGFVFVDGRYVEAPYRVSRRGVGLYINDVHLYDRGPWPPFRFDEVKEDPGLPPGLTTSSVFDDLRIPGKRDAWDSRKYRWLLAHYEPEEARRRFLQWIQQLPFVKKVEYRSPWDVVVEHLGGKKTYLDLTVSNYTPPTKEQVVRELDRIRGDLENRLAKGDGYLFFFGGGLEISFGKTKAARDLGLVAEILGSARTKEEKGLLLERLGVLPREETRGRDVLVNRFQPSDQLDRRVEVLVKQTGVKPRRLADLPPLPPDPVPMKPPAAVKGTAVD